MERFKYLQTIFVSWGFKMRFVTINFFMGLYDSIYEGIIDIAGNDFFRGLFVLMFWAFIIALFCLFIFSFLYDWRIGTGIVGFLIAVEVFSAVGRAVNKSN